MAIDRSLDEVPLPSSWSRRVKSSILQVISLAHLAIIYSRSWAANSSNSRVRLQGKLERTRSDISLLTDELRIKDGRMGLLDPHRRPYYRPADRLAILELKAARGWSGAQTARRFQVEPATIASWLKRVDEEGKSALVQTPGPVNRFPDFVRHIVQRLKVLCPIMGKKKIAQTLARAGLHLGVTTVGRMLKEEETRPPAQSDGVEEHEEKRAHKPVSSKYPNHVWLVDLTVVPTSAGFWAAWMPFALPQLCPFCWWVACVVDHYSRRVMGFAVFSKEPTSLEVRSFLGRAIARVGITPKYLISDKGGQFTSGGFRVWCSRRGTEPRYAATGQRGATAVIERFFKSLKEEWLRRIQVPLRRKAMRRELSLYTAWFTDQRPHQGLGGRTPNEVYEGQRPANTKVRFEPRPNWPMDSPCALPLAKASRREYSRLTLNVRYLEGNRNLPIVELKPAA